MSFQTGLFVVCGSPRGSALLTFEHGFSTSGNDGDLSRFTVCHKRFHHTKDMVVHSGRNRLNHVSPPDHSTGCAVFESNPIICMDDARIVNFSPIFSEMQYMLYISCIVVHLID